MSVPIAARLAEALNLPGNPVAAVDAARDKFATRAIMADAGLATPANCLIHNASELDAAAAAVGFPAVIKPIAGAGSMGVVRVDSKEELEQLYAKVVADMGRAVVTSGALVYAPESGETGASSKAFEVVMMMEQYLDGAEVDVDIVLSEGVVQYAEVTDNWPTLEPYFQEVGANCPSTLTAAQQKELIELSVAATLSLGFTCGVFHVESKYTSHGARLIEVNCRMARAHSFALLVPMQSRYSSTHVRLTTPLLFLRVCVFAGRHAGAQHQPADVGRGLGGGAPAHGGGPAGAPAKGARAADRNLGDGVQRAALGAHEGPLLHRGVEGARAFLVCRERARAPSRCCVQDGCLLLMRDALALCLLAQSHPNVISARPLVAAGELVTGPEDGMPTWCVFASRRAFVETSAECSPACVILPRVRRYAEIVVSFPTVKEGWDLLYAIDAQWRKEGGLPIVPK